MLKQTARIVIKLLSVTMLIFAIPPKPLSTVAHSNLKQTTILGNTTVQALLTFPTFIWPWSSDENGKVQWTGGPHSWSRGGYLSEKISASRGSGLDFAKGQGETFDVYSMAAGTVIKNKCGFAGLGCIVAIKHDVGGGVMIYAHLKQNATFTAPDNNIQEQKHYDAHTPIGHAGQSGPQPIVHLHLELRDGAATCNAPANSNAGANNGDDCGDISFAGNPVGWDGRQLVDNYHVYAYFDYLNNCGPGADCDTIFNYDGSAVKGSIGAPYIGFPYNDSGMQRSVEAFVHPDFITNHICDSSTNPPPTTCEINTTDTIFADHGTFGGGGGILYSTNGGPTSPPPPSVCINSSAFVSDVNIPDNTVLTANQSFNKTWRVRNTGSCTWNGYSLAFTSGVQMGGPASVPVPTTAPGQTADITVPLVAPNGGGSYRGNWQLKDNQGVNLGGGSNVWVQISVPYSNGGPPPTGSGTTLGCTNCPSVVAPGQQFQPQITVQLDGGQLLESRGDMLRNQDGNLYGAYPFVAVSGTVNAGTPYTFTFYPDHPMMAPSNEGNYQSVWQLWQNGAWVGPTFPIAFTVKNGGGTRPDPPNLNSPGDWYASRDGSTPNLCASAPGGLEYYFELFDSHDTPNSGWGPANCWTPPGLGPYTYEWHVKVRDPSTGLESDWSSGWHFTLFEQQLSMEPISFSPSSPTNADGDIKVRSCVHGFGDINLGLWYEINAATDGSANGEWHGFSNAGNNCPDPNNVSTWGGFPSRNYADGDHLVRAHGTGPSGQTMFVEATLHLDHRRPQDVDLTEPINNVRVNSRDVSLVWRPSISAQSYQLVISANQDMSAPLFDQNVGNVSSYQYSFAQDISPIYWQVTAFNDVGQVASGVGQFGIDRVPPTAQVAALPSTLADSTLTVTWNGADNDAGVGWYNIQYRDGNAAGSAWQDWQTNTTAPGNLFAGQPGHTYYFRAQAMDNASNVGSYATGDGDTHTTIDVNSRPNTPWWNPSYSGKRNLIILNTDQQALPNGYPVRLHFDNTTPTTASDLYNASQSAVKGDDFRVVYNNQTELSRFVQTFRSDRIDIWFDLQTGIGPSPGSDTASYQLYYTNAQAANPPGDVNNVLPPGTDANAVGLWHTQEDTGTSLFDSSGHGHTGTINNGSLDPDNKFGGAVVFNGSSTTLDMGDSPDFDLRAFTLEGWFYFANPGTQTLMRRDTSDHTGNAFQFATRDGKIEYSVGGQSPLYSRTQFQPNRWYHLAVTYDGTTQRIFVNGQEDANQTNTVGTPASAGSLLLGANRENSDRFIGKMQHIRVSNVARTAPAYGSFANILSDPSLGASSPVSPPQAAAPSLAIQSANLYPQADGTNTLAVVIQNQGNTTTGNGFATNLYLNHQPTGPGDQTGTVNSWIASPIDANQAITLTTALSSTTALTNAHRAGSASQLTAPAEITQTFYLQTDATGALAAYDQLNQTISGPITVCATSTDGFEGDESPSAAKAISTGGSAQMHNFDKSGDQDWVAFAATAGTTYTAMTANLGPNADTVLALYAADGTTLLATNDDYSSSLASQIVWQAPANGTYFLKVNHWNPNVGGCGTGYNLTVSTGTVPGPSVTPTSTPSATPSLTSTPSSTSTPPVTPSPSPTPVGVKHKVFVPLIKR